MKQKKNNDINSTIISQVATPSVDKIDKVVIETNNISNTKKEISSVKTPIISPITKSKKLSLDSVDEHLKSNTPNQTKDATEIDIKEPKAILKDVFEEKWKSYINIIKNEHANAGLAMSFEQSTYNVEMNIIDIYVNSVTTKEMVDKDKTHLIDYLAKHLDNDTIKVNIKVSDQAQEMNKKSLSPNDKLKIMIEENPSVLELMKLLNLEIDY